MLMAGALGVGLAACKVDSKLGPGEICIEDSECESGNCEPRLCAPSRCGGTEPWKPLGDQEEFEERCSSEPWEESVTSWDVSSSTGQPDLPEPTSESTEESSGTTVDMPDDEGGLLDDGEDCEFNEECASQLCALDDPTTPSATPVCVALSCLSCTDTDPASTPTFACDEDADCCEDAALGGSGSCDPTGRCVYAMPCP